MYNNTSHIDVLLFFGFLSAALPSASERLFYDGHDRKVDGSTPTQTSLLRFCIRCFTTIISAWWILTSRKLKKSQAKFKRKTQKQRQLLSESEFVQCIAPPSLSRDRRMKMKKSNQALPIAFLKDPFMLFSMQQQNHVTCCH